MNRSNLKILLFLLLFLPALACGNGDSVDPTVAPQESADTPVPEAGIQILEATFAHGLSEEMQPVDAGSDFGPEETIYLSLKVKGRPEEGVVTARFYWGDDAIADAGVDLADVNSGVIFSIGEDTYVGYTLTHEQPFPVSDGYRAEVFYGEEALGTYPFRVVPPPEAIPTVITNVTLARGADENYDPIEPANTFAPADEVYLVGHGDLGIATWLQAEWFADGQLNEDLIRNFSLSENAPDVGFSFSGLPEGGWPPGEHYVVLTVNGQEIGSYSFTITE